MPDGFEHARGVGGEVDFADGEGDVAEQGLEFGGGAVAFVDAGHEEVDVPAGGFDVIDDGGHVGGDADLQA